MDSSVSNQLQLEQKSRQLVQEGVAKSSGAALLMTLPAFCEGVGPKLAAVSCSKMVTAPCCHREDSSPQHF